MLVAWPTVASYYALPDNLSEDSKPAASALQKDSEGRVLTTALRSLLDSSGKLCTASLREQNEGPGLQAR